MRVGLIADIHANTVALDAVIADMQQRQVELAVCLGDIAANGPDPAGAIERVAELGCLSVMGNTDAGLGEVPEWWRNPDLVGIPEAAHPGIEIGVWCASQIGESHRQFLADLPLTLELDLDDGGRLLAFHGSPRSYDDMITAVTPEDELDRLLAGTDHTWLVGGHTHVPLVRRHGGRTILNPGSVGLPFDAYGYAGGGVRVLDHAAYGILFIDRGAVSIELRQVAVDTDRLARLAHSSGMPHSEWWLALRD